MLDRLLATAVLLAAAPALAAPPDDEGAVADRLESQQEKLHSLEEQVSELRSAVPLKSGSAEAGPAEPDPFTVGGALRFNYHGDTTNDAQRQRGGDAGLELFRLDVDGEANGLRFSAEYRWHPYMDVLHHGWLGQEVGADGELRLGVHQVPFGLLPYAAHNYWFGVPYYTGLADDHDLGMQYLWQTGAWDVRAAFYKNPEVSSPTNHRRYGFDVVHGGCNLDTDNGDNYNATDCNQETNQANLRLAYTLNQGGTCPAELGASGQYGELYNAATDRTGHRWAAAAHMDMRCGRWNLQLQAGRHVLDPKDPAGERDDTVSLGALAGSYRVARKADLAVANLAYNFPVPWQRLDMLTCYNDFSIYAKDADGFRDTRINTTGCAVGAGPLFVYADHVHAESAPYLSGAEEPLAEGESGWESRYNLNVGYYF